MSMSPDTFPVLLVEDNPVSRTFMEKVLKKAGYNVTCAENGLEAYNLFQTDFFPIVVTDWMMPEMDGPELCKAIRTHESRSYVFIILLTAKDSKEDIIQGFNAGADDYLIKPPDNAELLARIKTGIRILELEKSLLKATEEIKKLSNIDPLTRIYNRGYLYDNFSKEVKRALRYGYPLSIALCDIDHFKKVNDTFGHLAGDQVLKEFALCINDNIRTNVDWIVRFGGEEFLIVLPETDLKDAFCMAERLRKKVSRKRIHFKGNRISIKVSIGLSGFRPETTNQEPSLEMMINQADRYLYKSKQNGRNQVCGPIDLQPGVSQ